MATRNIGDMRDDLKKYFVDFQRDMKSKSLDFMLTCVARFAVEQKALYAQGREILDVTNSLRKLANWPPISEAENKIKVTWTLNSKHLVDDINPKSRAFDIAIMYGGKPSWNTGIDSNNNHSPDYAEAGKIWESISPKCRWGGRFNDAAHFEVI